MSNDEFRLLIERGDVAGLRRALKSQPALANQPIRWFLNQQNESDPLHYVSDCVGHGWLTNGCEGEIAEILIVCGAAIEGNDGRESALIAATSLGAEKVSKVLIEAGAPLEATSIYGARALHWAAWMGASSTVSILITHGADIEAKCSEFVATPLFWAVHGYGPNGPREKTDQVGAARILMEAGAKIDTANREGVSAIQQAKLCERSDMRELLLSPTGIARAEFKL
jgi:ankyrin repeat protein